jgi:predicted HicB family RNase H-like nuclease
MKYKGYSGHVVFDEEADIFHGEVINTTVVITFQGVTVVEVKKVFKESVDDYLEFCEERGESPKKPFSGKFNLRLGPELHQKAYILARKSDISLNLWVVQTIQRAVGGA